MSFPIAALLIACASGPAIAETYPSLAAATAAYKAELSKECALVGSTLDVGPGFVREIDLNGDGVPDAILSTEHGSCATAPSLFAGSAGESARWVVSVPAGGFETMAFIYHGVEIDPNVQPPRLTVFLHGLACGKVGAETCRHVFQLSGARVVASAWPDGQARPEPTKATASPASDPVPVMTADHNGSTVELTDDRIVYSQPKASLRGVVKPGTVLVEGEWNGERFSGTAYAFKKGCPPAPYAVSGGRVERPGQLDMVLRGAGPIRKGCAVVGYSDRSPHSRLVFEKIMSE